MVTITGTSVFGGVAFGRLALWKKQQNVVRLLRVDNIDAEVERFEKAMQDAVEQLQQLYDKALAEVGEANAMIFEIHQMMLQDDDYQNSVRSMIHTQKVNAEYAVATTGDNFARMFSEMDDDYMKERAADVKDISERLVQVLSGGVGQGFSTDEPVILAADDLAPSETVQLDKSKILAFVTAGGSSNSHTAILARMMNIPAIVGVGAALREEYDGRPAIVDGLTGTIYIDPDAETRQAMEQKAGQQNERRRLLEQLRGKENRTVDGQTIDIFANIGSVGDVAAVLRNDAGGIGLFRSEFLYLESSDYPDENTQFIAYKTVAETMAGRKVVIRTLDIGADKQIDYFGLPQEENPAMGYRAIRICLDRPSLFRTQLRALYRATAFGNISLLFPMITSVDEVRQIKSLIETVQQELTSEGIAFRSDTEIGIMIETPAAAMISDDLAAEVDFFSVGTNDLTQYTLALDRQNPQLDKFYNPHHKAILRMIRMAADNIHHHGGWIGICGELASDTSLTETFLSMGIDELSVSPPFVLPLRDKVRGCDVGAVRDDLLQEL